MAHIELSNQLPGIIGLLTYRPETAKPLNALAETLLRGDSTLSRGERELIASHVSSLNDCKFCMNSHSAVASYWLKKDVRPELKMGVDGKLLEVSDKMHALLKIAGQVQQSGRAVTGEAIAEAKGLAATDLEIHDTVLIAAAFCMYNRYVDGLGTWCMDKAEEYAPVGELLATVGYENAIR